MESAWSEGLRPVDDPFPARLPIPFDASLLTIGQYPTTVSVNDLQRVISLMFAFSAIPTQPSVKAMIFH